jgi:hypothetical protein
MRALLDLANGPTMATVVERELNESDSARSALRIGKGRHRPRGECAEIGFRVRETVRETMVKDAEQLHRW